MASTGERHRISGTAYVGQHMQMEYVIYAELGDQLVVDGNDGVRKS